MLAITFAVGVATGIVMEFQFGMNWAEYSKLVGDVFGAPLAAEAIFAFFLESVFLGLYLFGRDKISPALHWFSCLMVAVGATLSAFWIIVANSWQQTPAGFIMRDGRAELTSFWEAVFNPSTLPRFFHTLDATLVTGAFFVAGVAAYRLLRNNEDELARRAFRVALIFGLIVACLEAFPFGDWHARQVAHTQPEKLAAMEGLTEGGTHAPIALFAFISNSEPWFSLQITHLLSLLVGHDVDTYVQGLNEFPPDERPPVGITFTAFHLMVILGMYFIFIMAWGCFKMWRKKMWTSRVLLWHFVLSIPLPIVACELGWIVAEVGRQPWVVYKILRTADAASITVSAGEIVISMLTFGSIYALLGILYVYLIVREMKQGPEEAAASV
jgi:cytochrome d ubiquinol oxidase subunit I